MAYYSITTRILFSLIFKVSSNKKTEVINKWLLQFFYIDCRSKMISIKSERFDGVYWKLWWKISICFISHFFGLTKPYTFYSAFICNGAWNKLPISKFLRHKHSTFLKGISLDFYHNKQDCLRKSKLLHTVW